MPKISALPAAASAANADQIPANQSGTTRRVTVEQIRAGAKPVAEITGANDGIPGFDASGVGQSIPGWTVANGQFYGFNKQHVIVPVNGGSYKNLDSVYASLNPTVADADENWYLKFYEFSAGDDNSGNQVGDMTDGSMLGIGISLRSINSSNVGNLAPYNSYITLGNGTDPMTGRNVTMYNANPSLNLGGVEVENIFGFNMSFNLQTGSVVNQQAIGVNINGGAYDVDQFFGVVQGVNFDGEVGDATSFQSAHNFDDVTNGVNVFTDFNQQVGTIGNNYFSAAYNPNLDTITGGLFGLSINPTVLGCAYADGLNVNMSGVTSGGTVRAAYFVGDVEIDGDLDFSGSLAIGQLASFSAFTVVDGGGNPSSNNGLVSQINASGVVANCDTLGLNTACLINLDSTFQGTSGGFGIGIASMALPNVVSMEAGCNLDNLTACAYATTFDAANTGGTIGQLVGARSLAVGLGGTQTITRMYSFFADYFAGDVADDSWGFYDNGAKYNFMTNALKIGGSDTTTHNFEVDGVSLFGGNIGFYGTAPIAQPASSGSATAGGAYTATEQTMLQEVYDAVRALGLMS